MPAHDSGVASAMVSTSQQIGGSIGTALAEHAAISATTAFVTDHGPAPEALRQAAVEGYTTAFWWRPASLPSAAPSAAAYCAPAPGPSSPTARRSPRPRSGGPPRDSMVVRPRARAQPTR